jgi:hypothetical protein
MNFYATPEYLEVISEVYFKGKRASVEDVRIGEDMLRLLVVNGSRVIINAQFLDYHEPLKNAEAALNTRTYPYSNFVVRDSVKPARWEECLHSGFELAPYVDWSMFPTFDHYMAFILNRRRSLIREYQRLGRRLAEQIGPVAFRMNDDHDDVLELARLWKKRQLRRSGETDYFADPKTMDSLRLFRQRGILTASTLRAAGRLVSVHLGFVHEGVWGGWVFAYDPEFRKYSCGHQLMGAMLEESHRLGHRQFDFSIGSEPYKSVYATHARVLGTIGRPPLRQRVVVRLKRELKGRNPDLLETARELKRELRRKKSIYVSWLRGTEVLAG